MIKKKINSVGVSKSSGLDELKKLSSLKEKRIINEEEFNIKRKQLLGL